MNNTLKSAIPVAVISAVLVALFFVGYSFWFKERVLTEIAAKQRSDMDSLQSIYQAEMQKFSDRIIAHVDDTNKTIDAAIAQRPGDLFLSQGETKKLESEKVDALAEALMARLTTMIPTPEDQERGYNSVSQRVSDRLNPILTEIARTGNLTRSDVEFYSNQISGMIDGVLREEMSEKQQLNNKLLASQAVAQDALRLSQEMSALYLSSLKDQGVLSRLLSLPVRVVQDVSTLSIVGSSDRKKVEERLFSQLNSLERRIAEIQKDMPQPEANGSEEKFEVIGPDGAAENQPAAEEPEGGKASRARPTPPTTAAVPAS